MVDGFRQGKAKGGDDASEALKEAHAKIGELTLEKDFFVVCWGAEQTGAAGPHRGGLAAGHLPAIAGAELVLTLNLWQDSDPPQGKVRE